MAEEMREFTRAELSRFTGENGTPVYVAYDGKVFDVSESRMWRTGTHMKLHSAGTDLTGEIEKAPHETDVLSRFPQVGTIAAESDAPAPTPEEEFSHLPRWLGALLIRFPFFERHPHPMTVHFPIVFSIASPVLLLLYFLTGSSTFELAAFVMLGGLVIMSFIAIPTGYFTWWVNYFARPVRAVSIKIVLSMVLFALGVAAFVLRWQNPGIADQVNGIGLLYTIMVFALFPIVGVVGWFGASLTFPLRKRAGKVTE